MKWHLIESTTAALLVMVSAPFLLCAVVGFIYDEPHQLYFLGLAIGAAFLGSCFFILSRYSSRQRGDIGVREGFFIVTFTYVILGLLGSIPFLVGPNPIVPSFADALFESFSGWTTTGSTVLVNLDEIPRSILFFRALIQWIGGMGIIVLAVAILPTLGIGGMQLFRAEAPGTIDETSLEPRIREAAKSLWVLYFSLTIACAMAYWFAGMSVYDAICHAMTTIAIGGFSTHDASIGFFDSASIELVATVFMILAGINFALHLRAFRFRETTRKSIRQRLNILNRLRTDLRTLINTYINNSELQLYLLILVFVSILVCFWMILDQDWKLLGLRDALFHAISFATTTGYTTSSMDTWPVVCPVILILASFIGGCTGSTAGGIKVYRIRVVMQQSIREVRRIILPGGVFQVNLGSQIVPDRIIEAVWGFVFMYVACFCFLLITVLMVSDLDLISAFSAVAAGLNNLGPGIGQVGAHFGDLNSATKIVLTAAMLLGRLEIFTVLVLLAPRYWTH